MTRDWIINDAYFSKIKDSPISGDALKHFIDTVINKHPNYTKLLKNLSDVYVLIGDYNAQCYLREDEKTWKEIMKEDDYKIIQKNRFFVLSYMLVSVKDNNNHFIELFGTVVRNNNLGVFMINKYENLYKVNLVPQEIIPSSVKYWAKILYFYHGNKDGDDDDENDKELIISKEKIEEYIKFYNLNADDLSWRYLYELC